MSADFIQAERILRIDSALGADVLLAQKLHWREAISELFEGRVSLRSKSPDLTPQDLLGKPVDLRLELGGGQWRQWNAIVTDLRAGPRQSRGLRHYELILRPDLWLLSQRSDCRIWLDMSALEVAQTLMSEHGIAAPRTGGVTDPVPPQHYSVQWNETDLAYLTRRLEEDGLFFWWSHEEGAHRLHIASHASGYLGGEDVRFAHGSTDRNHINRFETTFRYIPGAHAGGDWNFQTPGHVPGGVSPGLINLPRNGGYERYEYPVQAGYGPGGRASDGIEDGAVERVARLRMQADEAEHARVEGSSNVRTLAAGSRLTPYDVANPDNVFAPHVILAIEHEVTDTSYESVENQPEYVNRFLALPADVPATPRRVTPQPRIDGTQVAIVAGPAGEEIHPDEYGRVKLWFPWDRRARKDGSDTCWVRVTQNWAGAGWGGQVIPRIGMEVMVSYLDGDPDRPVVTGVVPNARQKVPYDLPANKTRSTFRTNSHKGRGFNELRFEDAAKIEEILLRAQKDLSVKVLNNSTARIDRNEVRSIGRNRFQETAGNDTVHVGGSMTVNVTGNHRETYATGRAGRNWEGIRPLGYSLDHPTVPGGSYQLSVQRNISLTSGENMLVMAGSNRIESVAKDYSFNVGGEVTSSVTGSRREMVGNRQFIDVAREVHIRCGASTFKMDASGVISIEGKHIRMKADKIDLN
ncbi:type VI secretion system Vgr family protein [Paracoccus fistulariae]|uniref:Type VI secretion system tip protein VgrG n=2 Tax=Paracoccus fistulariae TaxID=658446 RepID=A0ABY7SHR4_9RHOB|nr:type VI secretion system tip protein TssI/VgrG [Paracoccus fistulariae]WCR06557.1 type VI secretion system tip protein VgrG [Paracoccus fistulariae]